MSFVSAQEFLPAAMMARHVMSKQDIPLQAGRFPLASLVEMTQNGKLFLDNYFVPVNRR